MGPGPNIRKMVSHEGKWGRFPLTHGRRINGREESLQVAGTLMAFKCLTRAHTKNFRPCPQLRMLKESFTRSGSSYWGSLIVEPSESTRVALAGTRQLPPQLFACSLKLLKRVGVEGRSEKKGRRRISQKRENRTMHQKMRPETMPAHTQTRRAEDKHRQTNVGRQHSAGFPGPLSFLASRY